MNSIYAIRDAYGQNTDSHGGIIIHITPPIHDDVSEWTFSITDNSIGLNDKDFKSFTTADTAYRIKPGGKGVGRLLWLSAFNTNYKKEGEKGKRDGFTNSRKI